MSSGKQLLILRKFFAFSYFVTQVFGLWPYNIDRTTRYNFSKFIYSIVLPLLTLYIYYTFGLTKLVLMQSGSSNYVQSKTMNMITDLYAIFIIVSYISMYVGQHFKFEISKSAYLKCVEVMNLLETFSNRNANLRKYFVNIFIKTIVFDVFNLLVLWFNVHRSSNILASHPYLPIVIYLPVMFVRLYENLFYGGVLAFGIFFKQLNQRLHKIVTTGKTSEIHRKNNIGKYCQLSDELDKLSKLHFELSEATKAFNSIFDIQLLLWIVVQLGGLIIRCFYQYVGIVHLLNSHESYAAIFWQNFITLVVTSSTLIEILLTSYACESLVTEVCTEEKKK